MRTGSTVQTRQGRATIIGPDPDQHGRYHAKLGTGLIIELDPHLDPQGARPIIGHQWATDLANGLICTWPDLDAVREKAREQQLTVLQLMPTRIDATHIGQTLVILCDERGLPVIGATA